MKKREKEYTAEDLLRDVIKAKITVQAAAQKMWDEELNFEIREFRQINVTKGLTYKVHTAVWDEWRKIRDALLPENLFVFQMTDLDWVIAQDAKAAVQFIAEYLFARGEKYSNKDPFPLKLTPDMCDNHEIRGEIFGDEFSQSFTKQLIWNCRQKDVVTPRLIYTSRRP